MLQNHDFFYTWGKWAESEKREARSERDVGLGLEGERKDRTCRNARTLISVKKIVKGSVLGRSTTKPKNGTTACDGRKSFLEPFKNSVRQSLNQRSFLEAKPLTLEFKNKYLLAWGSEEYLPLHLALSCPFERFLCDATTKKKCFASRLRIERMVKNVFP